ncbi:hypothetical protein [Nonomuraea longicatena]|uniref:Uncharacterized protein n=1 Tax=Nonomuraea longicatena TaxID=83682 RepID=A0ABN1NVT3_9ACTN
MGGGDDDIPPPPKGHWKPPAWGRPGCTTSRCFKDVADPDHSKARSEPISPIMQELMARQACANWWEWCRWSGEKFTEKHKRIQALHAGEGGIELCPKEVAACAGVPNPGNSSVIRLGMVYSSDRDGWQKAADTLAIIGSAPFTPTRTPRGRHHQAPRGLATLGLEGLRMGTGLVAHGIVDGKHQKMPASYYFPSLLYTQAKSMASGAVAVGSPIAGGVLRTGDRAYLNLHRPGVARALLDEALERGHDFATAESIEIDGWELVDGALGRLRPVAEPSTWPCNLGKAYLK